MVNYMHRVLYETAVPADRLGCDDLHNNGALGKAGLNCLFLWLHISSFI